MACSRSDTDVTYLLACSHFVIRLECSVALFWSLRESFLHVVQWLHFLASTPVDPSLILGQGLGRQNRQMSLWPMVLESYELFIKRWGHQSK